LWERHEVPETSQSFFPLPQTLMTIGDEVVVGCSTFSSGSENDESEEEDSEDDAPEEEDNVASGARGPQNGTPSETSSSSTFQFTIAGEKSNLN
jgi:hypothetical protein